MSRALTVVLTLALLAAPLALGAQQAGKVYRVGLIFTTSPVSEMAGPEIETKRLELLRTMLPGVSRVAYLASKEDKDWERPQGKSVRTAAQVLGVTLAAGRVLAPSVHRRLRADQPRPGRGALRLVDSSGLRRSGSHRGLRDQGAAAKRVLLSGVGGTRGLDVLWRERD